MDFQRFFLFLIFSLSLYFLWDGYQRYKHPEAYQAKNEVASAAHDLPKPVATVPPTGAESQKAEGKLIKVKTDYMEADISSVGGEIRHLEFLKHFDTEDKNKPFVLLDQRRDHTYLAQTGLLGNGLPTHNAAFSYELSNYQLAADKDSVSVNLQAQPVDGIVVRKILTFHRSSYLIDVSYEVENNSKETIAPSAYFQFVRDTVQPPGASKFVPTYTGPAVYTEQEKFQKVDFSSIDKGSTKYPKNAENGWIGMLQHYFVAAWLPKERTSREYYTRKLDNGLYSAGVVIGLDAINPGQVGKLNVPLYVGPAESTLDSVAPGLGLTVDYGWLTVIARPIFWSLTQLHGFVHNWGIAIVILTVLIKLLFFPLSAASYRSMAKMRVVAPKLEKIKQQYADDREKLNKAMMDLYKTEKINPLGGCLPVLIQIPVFIALYWAILSSVEMRYSPFYGWITDLSRPDPYYVLPLIMGISMLIQSKLNPTPPDPLQAKLMQLMPIIFSVVFFFFPAGLVLYSVVNNVLSIAQQWYITRKSDAESHSAKKA
ncbi:MAG TPA: membrane protein insertase YidC [Candidatus Paceibacterota bacterium]